MRRLGLLSAICISILLPCLWSGVARATEADMFCASGTTSSGAIIWLPCSGAGAGAIPTIPPPLNAYGTLAVTNSSVNLSTLTVGPNSAAWLTKYTNNYVSIRNSIASAGPVYFCPKGGACSATVGEPIAVGETIFRNIGNGIDPTLFSTLGATVVAEE